MKIEMNLPHCRFCNAKPSQQSVKGSIVYGGESNQKFWKCDVCQMIYLHPPPTEEEEIIFYKQEFEKYMAGRGAPDKDWSSPENHFQTNQSEVTRRMPLLENHLNMGQEILEIGCSSGFMLLALRDKGMHVYGLDPSEGFIPYVQEKGIPVFKDILDLQKEYPIKFDLIIHYYVLEHIRKPVDFIKFYMDLLKATGKMVFEVPCATDPLIELYRVPAFDKFYWSVAHHWYFTKESLSRVIHKTGYNFHIYPEQRYDLSNHLMWMLDGKPGGYGRYSHIFEQDLDRLYREKLKKNGCVIQ
jgi:SAM-dependent methyltransferase